MAMATPLSLFASSSSKLATLTLSILLATFTSSFPSLACDSLLMAASQSSHVDGGNRDVLSTKTHLLSSLSVKAMQARASSPGATSEGSRYDHANSMSKKLSEDVDKAVKVISDKAYEVVLGHIRNNLATMDKILEVLLEKETLTGAKFRDILSEYTKILVENCQSDKQAAPVAV